MLNQIEPRVNSIAGFKHSVAGARKASNRCHAYSVGARVYVHTLVARSRPTPPLAEWPSRQMDIS